MGYSPTSRGMKNKDPKPIDPVVVHHHLDLAKQIKQFIGLEFFRWVDDTITDDLTPSQVTRILENKLNEVKNKTN